MNPYSDLSHIRRIDDFAVELLHRHIEYTSGGERIAWFPAWEEAQRDLPHMTPQDVPLGSIDEPFEDADERWKIVIFEADEFVYVFEADHPQAEHFPRAFRVPLQQYLIAWAALLNDYNPIEPV